MTMNELAWYIARASGVVAWALLTASVLWGLALSTKVLRGRPRPNWILDLHRFLGGMALIFTGLHLGGLFMDKTVNFGPASMLIPFASSWRPAAVAAGVAGLYCLLAVELTSLARKQVPKALWRKVHFLSFPLFGFSTLHAITAGTDTGSWVAEGVISIGVTLVALLSAVRAIRTIEAQSAVGVRV